MKRPLSRRKFLELVGRGAACYACSSAAMGALGAQYASASTLQGTGKTLVLINFFGGIDGLSIAVPFQNQVYYDRRPTIRILPETLLSLSSGVGLNASLKRTYDLTHPQGNFAVVQQVGYPNANHSHFESQDIWSLGRRDLGTQDARGWLGRLADEYFDSNYDMFGVGVSNKSDFYTNRNNIRPIIINSLEDVTLSWDWYSDADNYHRKEISKANSLLPSQEGTLEQKIKNSLSAIHYVGEDLAAISRAYSSTVIYPENNYFAYQLKEIAKVIKANKGTQVFYTGIGGWDTHSGQLEQFSPKLEVVDTALESFILDLKLMNKWNDVAIICFSEFGRNCFENGSAGTDHGHGNLMLTFGGNVKGGIYGPVPSASDLQREFLDYYIDFRSVFKAAVQQHLGLSPGPVFEELIPAYDINLALYA